MLCLQNESNTLSYSEGAFSLIATDSSINVFRSIYERKVQHVQGNILRHHTCDILRQEQEECP